MQYDDDQDHANLHLHGAGNEEGPLLRVADSPEDKEDIKDDFLMLPRKDSTTLHKGPTTASVPNRL